MSPAQLHPRVEAWSPRGRAGVMVFPLLWVDAPKAEEGNPVWGCGEKFIRYDLLRKHLRAE